MKKLNIKKKAFNVSVLEDLIDQRALGDILVGSKSPLDEQSQDLLGKVYEMLFDKLKLSNKEMGAFNRIKSSIERGDRMSPEMHRNNIFKAANLLGIKLPSAMF